MKLFYIILVSSILAGCTFPNTKPVIKNMVLTSQPAPAIVIQNDKSIGVTPLTLEESDRTLTIFKEGYIPLTITGKANGTLLVKLQAQNVRLVNLFLTTKTRFVNRDGVGLMLEPVNRPVQAGVTYLVTEPSTHKEVLFTVISVNSLYVELEVEGHIIALPIIWAKAP